MKEHFTCHLCERNGIKYHYFKDYRSLERHFRRQHFICEDKGCLEKKFIVFGSALDLRVRPVYFLAGLEATVHCRPVSSSAFNDRHTILRSTCKSVASPERR